MNESMDRYVAAFNEYSNAVHSLKDAEGNLFSDPSNEELRERVNNLRREVESRFNDVRDAFIALTEENRIHDTDSDEEKRRKEGIFESAYPMANQVISMNNVIRQEKENGKDEFIEGTKIRKPRDRRHDESEDDYKNFLDNYYTTVFGKEAEKPAVTNENLPSVDSKSTDEISGVPAVTNTNVPVNNDNDTNSKDDDTKNNGNDANSKDDDTKTNDDDANSKDDDTKNNGNDANSKDDDTKTNDDDANSKDDDTKNNGNDTNSKDDDTKTNDDNTKKRKSSGKYKWLAGACGFGLGATVALTAAGGPVVATAFTAVAAINLASKAVNGVNWALTKYNEKKKNFQTDENGNLILNENGQPKTKPTFIDKIKKKTPDWVKKGVAIVTGNTKNQTWNWFVNGTALGYAVGNIAKNFIPKPDTNQATVTNKVTTDPNPNPNPNPNPTPNPNPQPTTTQVGTSQVDPGSHWNLENLDAVYDSADKVNGPLSPLKGEYGDAVVRRILDTPNGRMVDLMSPSGEDLAWVAEEAVKSGIRK